MSRKLKRSFYARDTLVVARELIGHHLVYVHEGHKMVGRIVETEAYQGPEDLAAHSAGGHRSPRNEVMFGPPGYAYVYFIYGVWHCLNFVTREHGVPHAVLLRALEPVTELPGKTNGPGLLCRTLGLDRRHNGLDLTGDVLYVEAPKNKPQPLIQTSPRIGIGDKGEATIVPWRFFDARSSFVSGRRIRPSEP
jgi:DNA-3-methyladenine glycosylase